MVRRRYAIALAAALVAALPAMATAQLRKLKVVSSDSQPIAFAYVAVEGGNGQITDETGEVSLGAGKRQTLTLRVQRIGYQPWFGKLELPDTAALLTIPLARIAQSLSTVTVTGTAEVRSLKLTGFYDRWLMRQKGTLSAVFIGPEEIEFRHPDKITNMLRGLNGVTLKRTCDGDQVAFGINGLCQMAILVDGNRQCPQIGCKAGGGNYGCRGLNSSNSVVIDQILDANDIAAIEVYNRGGNVPVTISASDQSCGIIAFWTGSRKP
jgi:hypothetical protein